MIKKTTENISYLFAYLPSISTPPLSLMDHFHFHRLRFPLHLQTVIPSNSSPTPQPEWSFQIIKQFMPLFSKPFQQLPMALKIKFKVFIRTYKALQNLCLPPLSTFSLHHLLPCTLDLCKFLEHNKHFSTSGAV